MRQSIISIALLLPLSFFSCSKGPGFVRSYGDETTVTRTLEQFNSFSVGQKFEIYLTQDTSIPEQISIRYGSHLLDNIQTEVDNGELVIRDANHYNWVRNLDVQPVCTLNVHGIDRISMHGASQLHCLDTIHSNNLTINANGVGRHDFLLNCGTVSGSCNNAGWVLFRGYGGVLAWTCENGGYLDASGMRSSDVYIFHYTDRNIAVDPRSIFKAYVYGKGNVLYYRDPWYLIEKHEFGEGRVIKQ